MLNNVFDLIGLLLSMLAIVALAHLCSYILSLPRRRKEDAVIASLRAHPERLPRSTWRSFCYCPECGEEEPERRMTLCDVAQRPCEVCGYVSPGGAAWPHINVRLQGDGRLLVRRNSGRDKMEEIK